VNFEELHNEINSYPPELNYKDEYWQGALKVIKAHERKQALKKWGSISLCALLLSFGVFSALQSEPKLQAEYSPRPSVSNIETLDQISIQNTTTAQTSNSGSVSSSESSSAQQTTFSEEPKDASSDNEEIELTSVDTYKASHDLTAQGTDVESKEVSETSESMLPSPDMTDVTTSDANESAEGEEDSTNSEEETNGSPSADREALADQAEPLTENQEPDSANAADAVDTSEGSSGTEVPNSQEEGTDSGLLQNSFTQNGISQNPSFEFVTSRRPNLNLRLSDQVKGDKLTITQDFRMPLRYTGARLAVIPYAEFGRTNTTSKNEFSVGLFMQRPITEKLGYNIGVGGFEMSGMETPVSSTHTTYGFGFESNITTVHTDKLQFLTVPVNLTYALSNRIQLGTGLGADYLIRSVNTLEETVQTNSSTETVKSEKTQNYFSSFNRALVHGNLGVNYWWKPRTRLGASYQVGLSDITKNEVFGSNTFDRNSRLNLSISFVIK